MRKQHALIAAAALVVGGLALPGVAQQQTDNAVQRGADRTTDRIGSIDVRTEKSTGQAPQLPAGIQQSTKDDSEDIRDMLASATEAAFTNGGFDDLVERMVDADRNRLNTFANQDKAKFATLNGRIEQIKKDWKAKYNQDFDLKEDVVFGNQFPNFQIAQGEIANPALLSNWPLPQKQTGAAVERPANAPPVGAAGNEKGDRNLEKGRNVAVVVFPASHGLPAVTASLIHELPDNWKLDIPDSVSGQQLHDQLLAHLTKFGEMKDQWPADVNEAYRMAAHHVLGAAYNATPATGAAK